MKERLPMMNKYLMITMIFMIIYFYKVYLVSLKKDFLLKTKTICAINNKNAYIKINNKMNMYRYHNLIFYLHLIQCIAFY